MTVAHSINARVVTFTLTFGQKDLEDKGHGNTSWDLISSTGPCSCWIIWMEIMKQWMLSTRKIKLFMKFLKEIPHSSSEHNEVCCAGESIYCVLSS